MAAEAADKRRKEKVLARETVYYGLMGKTHGGAVVLTVMSAAGASIVTARLDPGEDLIAYGGAGRLTQFHEKRGGAIRRLVERHGILLLSKPEWDRKKDELGEAVWA